MGYRKLSPAEIDMLALCRATGIRHLAIALVRVYRIFNATLAVAATLTQFLEATQEQEVGTSGIGAREVCSAHRSARYSKFDQNLDAWRSVLGRLCYLACSGCQRKRHLLAAFHG